MGGFLWHPQAIIQSLLLFVQYFYFALSEDWPLIEAVPFFFFSVAFFKRNVKVSFIRMCKKKTLHRPSKSP